MRKYIKIILLFDIIVLVVFGLGKYCHKTCSMDNLPVGDLENTYHSNNGKYTLNTYLYSPGALVNFSLRVETIDNETKEKRNIYWNFDETAANIKWIDEEIVIINGKKINLINGWFNVECLITKGVFEEN